MNSIATGEISGDSSIVENYDALQYMYCHPENIILQKGKRRTLRWQHLISRSQLVLSVRKTIQNQILSMKLWQNLKTLEVVDPLPKYLQRNISVIVSTNWISIKWATRKGYTQFQLMLRSPREIKDLVDALRDSTVPVTMKNTRSTTLSSQISTTKVEPELQQYSSQSTMVDDNIDPDFITQAQGTQGTQGAQAMQATQATQIDTQSETSSNFTTSSRQISVSNTNNISLFGKNSALSTASGKWKTRVDNINISNLIRRNRALHLSIETYSYAASSSMWSTEPLRWYHLGLTSDLCLSLVSADHNGEPVITITRGMETLEAFVPHPGYMRVYFAHEILTICQIGMSIRQSERYIQVKMKQANVAITCEWLLAWQVCPEDPQYVALETDATSACGMIQGRYRGHHEGSHYGGSEMSHYSRDSRFWAHRAAKAEQS